MKSTTINKLIVATALAVSTSLFAADSAAPAKPADKVDKSPARPATSSGGEAKKDVEKFNAQRDEMLAKHDALMKQMKNATEEQKKAIQEKMKDLVEAQREMSKQIRDDLRKLHRTSGASGRN